MTTKLLARMLAGISVFASLAVSLEPQTLLAAEPSPGAPACEEFYDKWEVPGVPSAMLAMAGLGREVIAAKDCVNKGNIALACKHWQGLLSVIDKLGPPLSESRGDIEALMAQNKCAGETTSIPTPPPNTDGNAGSVAPATANQGLQEPSRPSLSPKPNPDLKVGAPPETEPGFDSSRPD
jgi:hypothetical protein